MVTCHFHRYYKLHSNMKQKKLRQLRISLIFLNFISFFMANFLYFLTELLEISSLTVQLFCLLRFSGTAVNTLQFAVQALGNQPCAYPAVGAHGKTNRSSWRVQSETLVQLLHLYGRNGQTKSSGSQTTLLTCTRIQEKDQIKP